MCSFDGKCTAPKLEGAPCMGNAECVSKNCGVPAAATTAATVCLVALGAACTDANCESCDNYTDAAGDKVKKCAQSCTLDEGTKSSLCTNCLCPSSKKCTVGVCRDYCVLKCDDPAFTCVPLEGVNAACIPQ